MRTVKLDDILKIQIGKTPSRAVSRYWGVGVSWCSIADLKEKYIEHTKEQVTEFAINECNLKLIPKGTILFSFKLSIGKLAITKKDLYTNEAICGLTIIDDRKVNIDYLYYALKNVKYKDSNLAVKGRTLNTASLKSAEILMPETYEQQVQIATILSKIEGLIEKRKQSIELIDEYVRAVFLEMFGDPVRNERGWEVKRLRDVCTKITDGTHFSPPIVDEGIPYVTAKHVRENKIDFWANPWFISQENHDEIYKRCDPKIGDVLYIKDGATTGYAALNKYDFEFSMLSSLALLRTDKSQCTSEYLCCWLNDERNKEKILKEMAGGAIQRLTLTKINELKISLPSIDKQIKFSKIFEKYELIKIDQVTSFRNLETLYSAVTQMAFKGELELSNEIDIDIPNKSITNRVEEVLKIEDKKFAKEKASFKKPKPKIKDIKTAIYGSTVGQGMSNIPFNDLEGKAIIHIHFKEKGYFTFEEFEQVLLNRKIKFKIKNIIDFIKKLILDMEVFQRYGDKDYFEKKVRQIQKQQAGKVPEHLPLFNQPNGRIYFEINIINEA